VPGAESFAGLVPPPTVMDAIAPYIKNISQFAVLLGLLLPMGAVAQEKDKGTAALMLAKPLPRSVFLGTKFIAYSTTFLISLVLAAAGAYYYTLLLFSGLPATAWLAMNGLLWLYTLVILAQTLFFSTLFRSQAAAAGLSFGVIILLSIFGAFPSLAQYLPTELIQWGGSLLAGQATPAWPALWVSLGLIVAYLLGAWLVFRKQEL